MITRWSIDELVLLTRHYATKPKQWISDEIRRVTGVYRSTFSINAKAFSLNLLKDEDFRRNYHTPLRDVVIEILAMAKETTVKEMATRTHSPISSCYKILRALQKQGNIHVCRWLPVGSNNHEAVYRIGAGKNIRRPGLKAEPVIKPVKKTPARKAPEITADQDEPVPIPKPAIGPWGLCWTSTQEQRRAA